MMKRFTLPATLTNLISRNADNDRFLAHSLDFDITAEASTEDLAWKKLRIAVKTYVEFGLGKGWNDYILFPASDEIRSIARKIKNVQLMPPLEIASDASAVLAVRPDENLRTAS